jgi:Ca-activated chloride channel family protein
MSARRLGFLGSGAILASAVGCLGAAEDAGRYSAASGGAGGAPPPVYAPWGDGPGIQHASDSGSSSSSGAGLAAGGASSGSGGKPNPNDSCDATFQATVGPVVLPYPEAKAMGTPALARGLIAAGKVPSLGGFAPSDFLNYYRVYDPAPANTQTPPGPDGLVISAGIGSWLTPTEYVLQIAVLAPARKREHAVALTVVVDTSISMAGESMARAQAAVKALAGGLQAGDTFALVTTKVGEATPERIAVTGPADGTVLNKAKDLQVDADAVGLGTAVAKGYDVAATGLDASMLNRVVLITDGAALPASLNLGLIAGNLKFRDITLTGVGVGAATSYRSELLDLATSVGSGANVYLDSIDEADKILRLRFDELMDTVVSDVDVTVALPAFLHAEAPPAVAPLPGSSATGFVTSQLGPGRALVFRQIVTACTPHVVSTSTAEDLTIQVRWRSFGHTDYTLAPLLSTSTALLLNNADPRPIAKASAIAAYADAIRDPLRPARLHVALDFASDQQLGNDADIAEIATLIKADPSFNLP